MTTELLLSADDRTGALEVAGLIGSPSQPVPVGPNVRSSRCCVRDLASRHLSPEAARQRMAAVLRASAKRRAHKMDAGLRGNWAYEVEVLLDAGFKVAVVCSYPDAGRRCRGGVVYIHGRPVLDSVFGNDPLGAPVSSRPAEVLEAAGVHGDVVVLDADDNAELGAAIDRAMAEDRIVVGASGALGTLAQRVFGRPPRRPAALQTPIVVLCGSLNPRSREQLAATSLPVHGIERPAALDGPVTLLATPAVPGPVGPDTARETAGQAAAVLRGIWREIGTLIVIGGDTVAAVIGDDSLEVVGLAAEGMPAADYRGLRLMTKGGGIGEVDALRRLIEPAQ